MAKHIDLKRMATHFFLLAGFLIIGSVFAYALVGGFDASIYYVGGD